MNDEYKFTLKERLAAGLYVATLASLTLAVITTGREPVIIVCTFLSGFLGGLLIFPAILNPDRFLALRALAAGCITTVFTAVLSSIFFAFYSGPLISPLLSQNDPSSASIWFSIFSFLIKTSTLSGLMFSSLGAPATVLFSYFLRRGKRKESEKRKAIIGWKQRLICALSMSLPPTILIVALMLYGATISKQLICFLLFPGGIITGLVILPHYLSWKEKRHAYAGIGGALSLITAVIINYLFYILFDLVISENFGDMFMDGGPFTEALFFFAFGFSALLPFGLLSAGGDYLYFNYRSRSKRI
ncbi:hypothetical protein [Kiloniella sp.]|uniref:hypothetical protein n=1 Tax=Kiloniella sp. TaxID=1938587 RepID=UPI003B017961